MNIIHGDCLEELKKLDDNSIDAVVCDPPYGLSNTKPQQVADVLKAWVTGDTKVVPGLKKDSLEDAFVKALKRSTVLNADNFDANLGEELVAFRVPLGVIPVSMFRPVNLNSNTPSGEKEIDGDGTSFKVEHLLGNNGNTEGGEGISSNIFRLRRRSNAPCSVTREGDSTRIRVSVWLGDNSFTESEGSSGVMAGGATEVVAVLSFDAGRGTAEFLPTDSALPGDFILTRSSAEPVGAITRTGGLPSVLESGEVSEVDASADGAGALDIVVGLPVGWHESHSSTSKGFMGASWDGFVPPPAVWEECMRVLKPGGHMAVFAGARTQDLMGLSIRLAGFEIRDTLGWVYGSGFPKSMDIGKAIDKGQGLSRSRAYEFTEWMRSTGITATQINEATDTNMGGHYLTSASQPAIATADLFDKLRPLLPEVPERIERLVAERTGIEWTDYVKREITQHATRELVQGDAISFDQRSSKERERRDIPATSEAQRWDGWGTSLKPAIEPIILARKPLDGTVANNVLAHGVGGLNIDACRVPSTDKAKFPAGVVSDTEAVYGGGGGMYSDRPRPVDKNPAGRFPANVLLDEHAAKEMDKQSGVLESGRMKPTHTTASRDVFGQNAKGGYVTMETYGDSGGASRFFPVFKYQAKAPKKERPVIVREDGSKIQHPTVKPLKLMEWLVTLITPEGGTVLDPFAGTGTMLQAALNKGFTPIGIEADADYIQLIHKRMEGGEQSTRNS